MEGGALLVLCTTVHNVPRIIKKSVKKSGFEFHKPHSLPVIGGLEGFLEFFPLHHGLKVYRHLRTDIIAAASAVESGMSRHFL